MAEKPTILITNDDGILADGMLYLVEALAAKNAYEIHVCAPDDERSGVGHAITIRQNIDVEAVAVQGATKSYQTSGTPVDCVSLALSAELFGPTKPTLVISGINKGSNVGYNVLYSGTVGGAREALVYGYPSLAISYDWKNGESTREDFQAAAQLCVPLIERAVEAALSERFPQGVLLNIDVPTKPELAKGIKVTRQGTRWYVTKWKPVPKEPKKSMRVGGGPGMVGVQLAQMGLAAAAAGLAKRGTRDRANEEVESVAPLTVSAPAAPLQGRVSYTNAGSPLDPGEQGEDVDGPALEDGWVTVTPLGLRTFASDMVGTVSELVEGVTLSS